MRHSLMWKLAGALLLVVLVSVGLTAFLANRSTAREFQEYVSHGNMMYGNGLVNTLSRYYSQKQNWDGIQDTVSGMSRGRNERLVVADRYGIIVGDSARNWLGEEVSSAGLSSGTPIIFSGGEVGRLYILTSSGSGMGMGGMGRTGPSVFLDAAEQDFIDQINSSLWITGVIAAAVALILGLVLTRQITRPVRVLTASARNIAAGDFTCRANITSRDELGDMAHSFNLMAANLEKAEQSRRQLTADIAHELRTPLTVIEGTVDAMLDGVFTPDREHLTTIKEQSAMLTRLINELRELSLADSGQLKLQFEPANIVELARRKLSQVEAVAQGKGIQLGFNVSGEIPDLSIDPARIEQVIANLLTNALRHTPPGGRVEISLETTHPPGEKPSVLLSVIDTGEGIAPEHLPHVFERFYKADSSRPRTDGGAGLGLAIVQQIVKAHGGKVWAESEIGKGSSFRIAFPVPAASIKIK